MSKQKLCYVVLPECHTNITLKYEKKLSINCIHGVKNLSRGKIFIHMTDVHTKKKNELIQERPNRSNTGK